MAGPAAIEEPPVRSNLIPEGREQDYRELRAPAASFLDMQIDEKTMYVAPLAITSGAEDRDGEITNPDGLIDTAYRINPIVMLQHSHRVAPMFPPVGTAEMPVGEKGRKYDLFRDGDVWKSGCRFSQANRYSAQTFAMVADGLIRGRSIGALNHAMSYYRPKLPGVAFHEDRIIPARTKSVSHDQYELVEWSWVYIPSNREIVTPMKSIMSKGWLDGRPLDPKLKFLMKSFDLYEPASNAKHMARKPRFNWPNMGEKKMSSPAVILFDSKVFNVSDVKSFLAKNTDIGIVDTEITSEMVKGQLYLKSTQFTHKGAFEECTDDRAPGLKLLYAKALGNNEPAIEDEISQIVAEDATPPDAAAAAAPAEEAAAGAPEAITKEEVAQLKALLAKMAQSEGAAGEAPAEDAAAGIVDAETEPGPTGMKYLKALIRKATALADEAEAALEEQEPEMMEKCGEFTSTLRAFIGKVAEFQDSRYPSKPEGEAKAKGDAESEAIPDEEEKQDALLSKATRTELFYGSKQRLPSVFVKGLSVLQKAVPDERHKSIIAIMLKGLAVPVETATATEPSKDSLDREAVRQILMKRQQRDISQLV